MMRLTQYVPLIVVLLYVVYYVLRRGREAWILREQARQEAERRRLNGIVEAGIPKAPGYPSRRIS